MKILLVCLTILGALTACSGNNDKEARGELSGFRGLWMESGAKEAGSSRNPEALCAHYVIKGNDANKSLLDFKTLFINNEGDAFSYDINLQGIKSEYLFKTTGNGPTTQNVIMRKGGTETHEALDHRMLRIDKNTIAEYWVTQERDKTKTDSRIATETIYKRTTKEELARFQHLAQQCP
jgi:hypothetical protein